MSKVTAKTTERRQWGRSGVFIVNFEHISHLVLMFLLLTLNMYLPAWSCSVSFQVVVFDGGRGSELQKLSCTGGTIFDVLTFEAYDSSFLVALTEQKLNFFKWQWTVSWKGKIWRNFIKCRCENGINKKTLLVTVF